MIISVTINDVLRDILSRFEDVYNKYHEEGVKSSVLTPDLLEYTHFKTSDELYEFMYEESPMEIFGQAKEVASNVMTHLKSLYKEMPKNYKLRIVGDDLGRAKSSTLWFLAKYGCSCDEISFYNTETVEEMWVKTDLFITADVDLIESKPENKELIIVDKVYNKDLVCNLRIKTIKEIESFENIYGEHKQIEA
jgi:5'(3')-deoxyribonucleotidase